MIPTHVYNEIREKFSFDTAEALVNLLEAKPATKEDLLNMEQRLKGDIMSFKNDITGSISRATWLIGILITLAVVIIKFA